MKIIIKETAAVETLSLIDPNSGVDYITDFIGSAGALDGQFVWSAECGAYYVGDQNTFDWWAVVINAQQALNDRIHELSKEHGAETVYQVIDAAGSVDLWEHAPSANQALDEAFGSAG